MGVFIMAIMIGSTKVKHLWSSIILSILLCTIVSGGIPNVEKSKWDWIAISPNHLEFDKPECKFITIRPTFRVTNYTEIWLELFGKQYPNGISTSYIFNLYTDYATLHKSEIKEVLVCAEYEPGAIPKGEYEATLMVESVDRVYQIPLTLSVSFGKRFTQKTQYEFEKLWLKELFIIPTPNDTYVSFKGYHFIILLISGMVFIWIIYLFYKRKNN